MQLPNFKFNLQITIQNLQKCQKTTFFKFCFFFNNQRRHAIHMKYQNNLEKNRSFRNRENLQYKETAYSVLLSLFMRTNGWCNNFHAPKHRLKRYSAFGQNPIFLKDQNMKKYQHYIDVRGEVLPTQASFYMKMKKDLISVGNYFSLENKVHIFFLMQQISLKQRLLFLKPGV